MWNPMSRVDTLHPHMDVCEDVTVARQPRMAGEALNVLSGKLRMVSLLRSLQIPPNCMAPSEKCKASLKNKKQKTTTTTSGC